MPTGPTARVTDFVTHPFPPVLTGSPGAVTVLVGFLPAWRGLPAGSCPAIQQAKDASDKILDDLKAKKIAAAGTPGAPAAIAAEKAGQLAALASMGAMITAAAGGGTDIHMCLGIPPVPFGVPHGPGIVMDGSKTVMINSMPACRLGDTVTEAIGGPNKIVMGCMTVIIGG